jgi:hypothetical protein
MPPLNGIIFLKANGLNPFSARSVDVNHIKNFLVISSRVAEHDGPAEAPALNVVWRLAKRRQFIYDGHTCHFALYR